MLLTRHQREQLADSNLKPSGPISASLTTKPRRTCIVHVFTIRGRLRQTDSNSATAVILFPGQCNAKMQMLSPAVFAASTESVKVRVKIGKSLR